MSEINRETSALYPPFGRLVGNFMSIWNSKNPLQTIGIFEGLRSFERQKELYAQGRTVPGAIVTNAMPGFSWHQYGLAVDLVFDSDPVKPGLQATWDGKFPWKNMGKAGEFYGLEWAGSWKSFPEFPHFQKTWGMQLGEARELFEIGELQSVWNALNLTRQTL